MKKNKRLKIFITLVMIAVLNFFIPEVFIKTSTAYADGYVVIINKGNDYSGQGEDAKRIARSIYLKKRGEWPNGFLSKPFARNSDSEIQKAFLKNILNMTEGQLAEYWVSYRSRSGVKSPREVSTNIVVRLVSKYEGALGFVSKADAEYHKEKVSILFEF